MQRKNISLLLMLFLLGVTILGLVLLSGYGSQATVIESRLHNNFDLKVGQNAVLGNHGIYISLDDVLDDSRCPKDTNCIWEGDVTVLVTITTNSSTELYTLSLNNKNSNKVRFGSYFCQLIQVKPDLSSSGSIPKQDYSITLLIGLNN